MDFSDIEKKLGKRIAFRGNETPQIEFLKTGLPALDNILGGGIPRGRITELYSPEGSGKTTLALQIAAQHKGVVWFDLERAWNPEYAEKLGVDLEDINVIEPDYAEEAIEILEKIINDKADTPMIVLDSIANLSPLAEHEDTIDKIQMGAQARLISKMLRRIIPPLKKSNIAILATNQMRVNIMGGQYNPWTRPGGKSWRHYVSLPFELKRTHAIKQGDKIVGTKVIAKVGAKNRFTEPFQSTELTLLFGKGFSSEASLLDTAIDAGVVEQKGRSYSFDGERFATSKKQALEVIENDEEFAKKIESEL